MATTQEKKEAREAIENHGTIDISLNYGIDCENELRTIGVKLDLVNKCLKMIDYYACSIQRDGEYHLAKDLDKETRKLRRHLDRFKINGKKLDYEITR